MVRIAVLDDFASVAKDAADWDSIPDAEVVFFNDHLADAEGLVNRLKDFEVIQVMRERTNIHAEVIDNLPKLKMISSTGGRHPHIDLEAAKRRGIVVTGTPARPGKGSGDATPELAWGLIIGLMRHIPWEDRQLRQGHWQTRLGESLGGKVLGIQGLGRVGKRMAEIAHVFSMDVIAWGPTLDAKRASESGATYVSWDDLYRQSDVLTIHVPLTDLSRGWIGARELGLMKPTAYLINTSRGPIVQEDALLDALRNHAIAGAAIDVYGEEPIAVGHPFLALDNVVVTPHLGYASKEGLENFYELAVENIKKFVAGEPINTVNPDALGNKGT
jgi:phosphoglycerate dehydrogenase-like enzyme